MLFMKMDLLNYQYLDKMNNNIGVLCYEGRCSRMDFFFTFVTAPPPWGGGYDQLLNISCLSWDGGVPRERELCAISGQFPGAWLESGSREGLEGTHCYKFASSVLTRSDKIVTL